MTEIETKRFKRFLKELGIYKEFITQTERHYSFHNCTNFKAFCKYKPPLDAIMWAFPWSFTPQTQPFWFRVNRTWLNYFADGIIPNETKSELKKLDASKNY